MTPNRSLELSVRIQELLRTDMLQFMESVFPTDAIDTYKTTVITPRRERAYSPETTLLTMVVTAFHTDRSLANSVHIFQHLHNRNAERLRIEDLATANVPVTTVDKRTRGRPRTRPIAIPKSKLKDISLNTAAFSKARSRLDQGLIDHVFVNTRDFSDVDCEHYWHGRPVYNTDGTYFQLQDTPDISGKYKVRQNKEGTVYSGYPQGLLQTVTRQGSGAIHSYCIGSRNQSELDLLGGLVKDIPRGSLLLADDLYNCYAMFSLLADFGIDIIAPEKKHRKYEVVKQIAPGDEIIKLKITTTARRLVPDQRLNKSIKMRRITYPDIQKPWITHTLITSILDESIDRTEIVQKYSSRWDIEITIREIKTIMGLNIIRAKSEEMAFREIGVALIAYNLLRKIVAKSAQSAPFSPETDIVQKLYSHRENTMVDKRGRVYSRWSPGRPANC